MKFSYENASAEIIIALVLGSESREPYAFYSYAEFVCDPGSLLIGNKCVDFVIVSIDQLNASKLAND